jgi:DNA ligase-1
MPDLSDGESAEVQGSGRLPYVLKNVAGVYSCSCPAWRNQSLPIDRRTRKHLRQFRGAAAEDARIGSGGETAATAAAASIVKPTPPPLLLAQSWQPELDPTGWLVSEKLDGVRAYWDGKQFFSRQGNAYHAPDWFAEHLPRIPLDGELWIGRKAFSRTVSIVRRHDKSQRWDEVTYLVFDAPKASGGFEQRLAMLRETFRSYAGHRAQVLGHEPCRGVEHLRSELARVEGLGGEGLMLRAPGSAYEPCRSPTLLKVKTFHDAEAQVIGHQPGTGRHAGRLGAVLVQLPSGIQFAVGSGFTDAQRDVPPAIGSTITFRYQELTDRGVPRFPTFVRIASDVRTASDAEVSLFSAHK